MARRIVLLKTRTLPPPTPSLAASHNTLHRTPPPSSPDPPPTFWRPSPRSRSPSPAQGKSPALREPEPPRPPHTCGSSSSGPPCGGWPAPGRQHLPAPPCTAWQLLAPWARSSAAPPGTSPRPRPRTAPFACGARTRACLPCGPSRPGSSSCP